MSAPCQNGETESYTWASTTSILHLNGKLTKQRKAWEDQQCDLQRDKGMLTQAYTSEETMNYSFLTLQILLLQCI